MKNNYLKFAIAALFLLCPVDGFSDAWVHYSGNCNWFSKKYKVHVEIRKQGNLFNWCGKTDADCYGVEEECVYPPTVPGAPFGVIYARAYGKINASEYEVEEYGGFQAPDQWLAGTNVLMQTPRFSPYPMIERVTGKSEKYATARTRIGRIEFDYEHHVIHLYDISGSIEVNSFDKANDFAAMAISVTKILTDAAGYEKELTDQEYTQSLVWDTRLIK